jgi:hypothetical protein
MRADEVVQYGVCPYPDEIGDPVGFAVLVDIGTGKSRITPEPEQFEFLPVPIHYGLDEIKNPI